MVANLESHENEVDFLFGVINDIFFKVKSLNWDYSNSYLASCSRDKTIIIWEYEKQDDVYDFSCKSILNGHDQVIIKNKINFKNKKQFL